MCKQFNANLDKFEKHIGTGPDKIIQLRDISGYLLSETGFRLKPVHGILSQRVLFHIIIND